MNEEISCLKNHFDEEHYGKITKYATSIVQTFNLSPLSVDILKIYYDCNSIKKEMPHIISHSPSTFEMLLYSHKLAFICSLSKPNSVYSNILSPRVLRNLRNIYIPGGEPNDSLLIISGDQINEHFQNGTTEAIYMCSCYYYYRIKNCGFPMEKFVCRNCGALLGGRNHKLIDRPGHIRIFLNESQKLNDFYINHYHFSVPYICLDELMRKVENERRKQIRGFKKVKKDFYTNNNLKVRNISMVTFRILNFIFYSCIYHNFKLGYLTPIDLKNFYYSDSDETNSSILSAMEDNWKSLIEELESRSIDNINIKCLLNLIIPEIAMLIINNEKSLLNPEERDEFENNCNDAIENIIKDYKNYKNTYIRNNNNILDIKDDTIESILQETSDLNKLSQKKIYPLINYCNITKYPNENDFYDQFKSIKDRIIKYPVTTKYLNALYDKENDIGHMLEIFNLINPFITYVLTKYDNKISRKEAKKITIEEELKHDAYMKKLFSSFQKGWELIYKKLQNYDCHASLPTKKITKKDYLAYVLNDKIDNGYGRYIATAYKTIITCQNKFLDSLISDQSKIIVQKASSKEIVSLTIENENYDSFEDLICTFSYRNYYTGNKTFDFSNYKNIKYDFDAIEAELSKLLLSGKKLLEEEQEQLFIRYTFEVFNQDETILTRYKEKIKKVDVLSKEEKTKLTHKIKRIDYKIIIFNLQTLFLYFINKKNITGEERLSDEIKKLPENLFKLDDEFITIFQNRSNNGFDLQLKKLINCYEHVEYINFEKILKNVPKNYSYSDEEFEELNLPDYINAYNKLSSNQVQKLNQHFAQSDLLIQKRDVKHAIRKLISRNMVSERFNNFNSNLFNDIEYKEELWNSKIISEENQIQFSDEIRKLANIEIKYGQIIDLYKKLEGESESKKQYQKTNIHKKNNISNTKGKRRLDY